MAKTYNHGGDIYGYFEKYGKYPVDFSANLNPLGYPKGLYSTFMSSFSKSFQYPPYDYKELIEAISIYEDVPVDSICVAGGASEIIKFLPIIFRPAKALITAPAFSDYKKSLKYTANIIEYPLKEKYGYMLDDEILVHVPDVNMIILCNPDNPTGNHIDINLLENIVKCAMYNDTMVVVDECFFELSTGGISAKTLLEKYNNLIILKAFTKTFSMAGFRLGYCISYNQEYIDRLNDNLTEWRVSTPAYMCGIKALEDKTFLEKAKLYIEKEKAVLISELTKYNNIVYGSKANYIFFKSERDDLKERFEEKGILIRSCGSYSNLDNHFFRIAVRECSENILFINTLREIYNG